MYLVQFQSVTRSDFPEKQPELIGCPHVSNGIISVSGIKPQEFPSASHIAEGDQRGLGLKLGSWVRVSIEG